MVATCFVRCTLLFSLSALHDRPCFSCRITLPCFDYLYPTSVSKSADFGMISRGLCAGFLAKASSYHGTTAGAFRCGKSSALTMIVELQACRWWQHRGIGGLLARRERAVCCNFARSTLIFGPTSPGRRAIGIARHIGQDLNREAFGSSTADHRSPWNPGCASAHFAEASPVSSSTSIMACKVGRVQS